MYQVSRYHMVAMEPRAMTSCNLSMATQPIRHNVNEIQAAHVTDREAAYEEYLHG